MCKERRGGAWVPVRQRVGSNLYGRDVSWNGLQGSEPCC